MILACGLSCPRRPFRISARESHMASTARRRFLILPNSFRSATTRSSRYLQQTLCQSSGYYEPSTGTPVGHIRRTRRIVSSSSGGREYVAASESRSNGMIRWWRWRTQRQVSSRQAQRRQCAGDSLAAVRFLRLAIACQQSLRPWTASTFGGQGRISVRPRAPSSRRGSLRLGSGPCRKGSPGRCGTGRPILRGRVAPLRGWLGGLPRGRPCVGGAGTAQTRSAPRPSFPRAPALQQRKRRAAGYGYRNDPPTAAQGAWLAVGAGARRLRRGRRPHRTSACRGGRGRRPPAACADTFPTGRRSGGAEWRGLEPVRRARGGKIINPTYRGCADFFCCRAFLGVFLPQVKFANSRRPSPHDSG